MQDTEETLTTSETFLFVTNVQVSINFSFIAGTFNINFVENSTQNSTKIVLKVVLFSKNETKNCSHTVFIFMNFFHQIVLFNTTCQ